MSKRKGRERSLAQTIFLTPDGWRLRSGWRLLGMALLLPVFSVVLGSLVLLLVVFVPEFRNWGGLELTALVVIVSSVYVARRWLDKRTFTSLGLKWDRQAWFDLLAGIGFAAVAMGVIFTLEITLGWLKFEGFAWDTIEAASVGVSLLGAAIAFIFTGISEELLFRGYVLQNLRDGVGMRLALFISSAMFGAAHLTNPNASWIAALGITLAGYFLAYGYLRTGQLWIPIGVHIGWNFFEGPVFGFAVSGLTTPRLMLHTVQGPELLTGGAFGPEAGLIVLPGMAVGAGLIWLYTRGRGKESG